MKIETLFKCKHSSFILAAFVFMFFVSCDKKQVMPPVENQMPADTTTQIIDTTHNSDTAINKRYLALGDSYTIGQSVDSSKRFPAQTVALLSQKNIGFFPIQYIATTGWTTTDLVNGINLQQPQGPFDAVSLLIGVNDQFQAHDTIEYRSRFTGLLNTAITLAGNRRSHVFVLSIPDYSVTPFGNNDKGISTQIDEFNAINKNVTLNFGISYTDVTTISRSDANNASMIAIDGLHPSGNQYAQWAQALSSAMFEVLK